ncbi:hypothetical protein [Janthinobacterium sp. GW458P]|uniref:hypothetical protein n=1 Tax=Janthinobacterium sp. GW458P TaxID=1981504 RepID=UPI00111C99B0|nr:hypothetical protein [Janthinobacterium sp. GW458P]MBE3027929.1 hypothetical protein [Janthinobacterium sp. GW458P]
MDRSSNGPTHEALAGEGVNSWLAGWLSPAPTTNQGTAAVGFQRWFHFKEAFSPSFVEGVIKRQPNAPTNILDPFSGSGTTALTSQFFGIIPTAIEVNPFLADLTEAKLSVLDAARLLHAKRSLIRRARALRGPDLLGNYFLPPTFIEPGVKERWIFNHAVAEQVLSYRAAIDELEDPSVQRLARVALGSVLIPASNAVVNGKGRRYRKGWQQRAIPDVDTLFEDAFSKIIEDAPLTARKKITEYKLLRGDSREQIGHVDAGVDLALFSPPYPNSFDYTDVYNVELWMLGYLDSSQGNRSLREQTLRSHVQIRRDLTFNLNSQTLADVYQQLSAKRGELWDGRIPEMIGAYFADLIGIVSEIGTRLSEAGRIELVVGDSQYLGVHLPVPKILEELAPAHGLQVIAQHKVRSMRSSAQQGGTLNLPESLVTICRN